MVVYSFACICSRFRLLCLCYCLLFITYFSDISRNIACIWHVDWCVYVCMRTIERDRWTQQDPCSRLFKRFGAELLIFVQFVLHSTLWTFKFTSMRYNFMDRFAGHPQMHVYNISTCVSTASNDWCIRTFVS